jgi:hypothetical protein
MSNYAHIVRIALRQSCRAATAFGMLIGSLYPLCGQSQWSGSSPGPIYYNGGNVGIGTTNPVGKTQVQLEDGYTALMTSNPTGVPRFALNNNAGGSWTMYDYAAGAWSPGITQSIGNVGVGTMSPQSNLDVAAGGIAVRGTNYTTGGPALELNTVNLGGGNYLGQVASVVGSSRAVNPLGIWGSPITFYRASGLGLPAMTLLSSGNVGIGTISPQHTLSVNGNVGAKEVIVTNTGWADHVFRPDYPLEPLSAVETHIQQHGRLPDIPSEEQVQTEGVNLGDMQVRLLAKIEELTLHLIEMDKRCQRLEESLREAVAQGYGRAPASARPAAAGVK